MSLELDLSPFIDQLVERIVDQVTERLAERLFGPPAPTHVAPEPAPEPEPVPATIEPPVQPSGRKQRIERGEKRTCEVCGRVGTRRYVQTPAGWKCSPTATACSPQFRPPGKYTPPIKSDIPAKPFPPNVTPASDPDPPVLQRMPAPGVTANCQDCSRTFTLTGRVLQTAVEMHELKAGHIVSVFDVDDAQEATA